jgi:hypothetical protein
MAAYGVTFFTKHGGKRHAETRSTVTLAVVTVVAPAHTY